jgi:glyoxylase-like metal-dependent hydrolase (beta-lactamase superfamily II)
MQILPLSEGSFTIDQSKKFIPFDTSQDLLGERPRGSLLVEIQPFVVMAGSETILLDTGLGYSESDGTLQIHHNLVRVGIDPMDVTMVLLSHLHKDHAGGIVAGRAEFGQRHLSFPNAMHYVQRAELDFAFATGMPSYDTSCLDPLVNSDKLVLLDGEGSIGDIVRYSPSGGHSPFHQVFWITEGGQTIFFGGDEAPQLHQMKNRFMAKYDHDGRRAMELRNQWWEEGRREGWSFLFYHDLKQPVVRPVNDTV